MSAVIYSVSRLNRAVRLLLNDTFGLVQVEGEISNHTASSAGHHYFTLKDAEAQVRCALFKGQTRLAGVRPGNGMQVVVRAEVSLYEPRGDYQLRVLELQEAGDGALMRAFAALKQRLLAEGLFEASRKRPLPHLPTCIGLITSPTGAALRDMLSVLKRRFPAIPVVIFPALVQGRDAAADLIRALRVADQSGQCDVLILARGGGSLEDLQAFNDEGLARTIAALHTPLVTGIGHEVDYTIADFVADLRAPTPSAAAETVTPDQADWLKRLDRLNLRLQMSVRSGLTARQRQWSGLDKRLSHQHPCRQLAARTQRLDELETRLRQTLRNRLRQSGERLGLGEAHLGGQHPRQRINRMADRLSHLNHRLVAAWQKRLDAHRHRTHALAGQLQAVSPLATLSRGYSITRHADSGHLIGSISDTRPGDLLETRLVDGSLISRVSEFMAE